MDSGNPRTCVSFHCLKGYILQNTFHHYETVLAMPIECRDWHKYSIFVPVPASCHLEPSALCTAVLASSMWWTCQEAGKSAYFTLRSALIVCHCIGPSTLNLDLPASGGIPFCRYVKTTDGTKRVFQPGEIMFQDNVQDSPADKQPEHESGRFWPPIQKFGLRGF